MISGTVSVAYIVTFVCIKAAKWGINLDFDSKHVTTYVHREYTSLYT